MSSYDDLGIISRSKSICLLSHINPDPDAIASLVVFRDFIEKRFGIKKIDMFAEATDLSENLLEILDGATINPTPCEYDLAIMLDCPSSERLGIYKPLFDNCNAKIVIDHHATNNFSGDVNIVEMCSSTCEIIYSILKDYSFTLSNANQGKLYSGIITDTNNFTVGNITPRTFQVASEITPNIKRDEIYKAFLASNSLKNMQFLSLAIQNISAYDHNQIIITYLTQADADKFNGTALDYIGIVNKITTINSAKLVCLIEPRNGCYYVSMRAKENYDVATIAKKFGGGGHTGAAAFTINSTIDSIRETILTEFREHLKTVKQKPVKLF